MTTKNTFSQVVDASVRAIYDQAILDQSSRLYAKNLGFTEYEPDVPNDQISSISGPGRGRLTVEGQVYGANEKYKGYPVTLRMDKYTSELSWTEEDMHWIQKSPSSKRVMEVKQMAVDAVNALNQNINEAICKVFYLGHGTTNLTGGDGKALYALDHTIRKTGGSQANTFPSGDTHRAFGPTALSDAISIMNRFKGMNDIQMLPVRRLRIFHSVELQPTVIQTLVSLYGPTNNNLGKQVGSKDFLSYRGIDIDNVVLPDVPYAYRNYWFLVDMDRAAQMMFYAKGWDPRMNDVTRYDKGQFANEASAFFGWVFNSWQWTFSSKGDGTTI